MSIVPIVDGYLTMLSQKLGIERKPLSPDGEAVIRCKVRDVTLDVHFLVREDADLVALETPVASIPQDSSSDLMLGLISGNLYGAGAHGLTFSISPQEGLVYIGHCLLNPGLSFESFEGAFARVVMVAAHWKEQFQGQPSTRMDESGTD